MKRSLTFFPVAVMLFSVLALASCGDKQVKEEESSEPVTLSSQEIEESKYIDTYDPRTTAETYVAEDAVENVTYDGYEFTFLNSASIYCMYLDHDMTGDVLDDCYFERNLLAEEKFDITISEATQPYARIL